MVNWCERSYQEPAELGLGQRKSAQYREGDPVKIGRCSACGKWWAYTLTNAGTPVLPKHVREYSPATIEIDKKEMEPLLRKTEVTPVMDALRQITIIQGDGRKEKRAAAIDEIIAAFEGRSALLEATKAARGLVFTVPFAADASEVGDLIGRTICKLDAAIAKGEKA